MASVYLAERRGEGYTQRVALKLVLKPASDPAVQRRSRDELRILAQLEHRNIARLIEGGLTEDEHPFYAMEYVDGIDLLRYCDDQRLGVRERLELFLEVCAPVQYAHERLIIHCDLKPNNILVTVDAHVKLLDFGVARLIDPEAEGDDRTGLWFTPAYASPEQVSRQATGTASDVYSLGVLLYEVLTGHRPYRFPSWSPDVVVETVGKVPPPPPSSVVTRPWQRTEEGDTAVPPEVLASARRSTPERIRKALRGDLDAIVMKALAKDPSERYATAAQLADDIHRFLEHRPVSSVPDTARYRAGKLLRRYRGPALAAGLVLFTLVGGLAATLWQAARATSAAALAREEAEKAALVASLMTDMFRLSDPNEVLGDTITARDLLDRGTARIQAEFGDQPLVQAQLLAEVAGVYQSLGLYRRAEPLSRQALELRETELGPEHLEVTESLIQLGSIQADLGLQGDAIETLERAVALREPRVVFPDSVLLDAQGRLGWLVRNAQRYDRAEELFRAGLEGQRALDPGGPGVADMLFGLASTFHDSGMLDEADSLLGAVIVSRRPGDKPTPMALGAIRNVGMIRRVREQYREAEPLLRTAVDMAEALYGPNHAQVFEAKTELGLALWGTGQWDEAEAVLREAILASSETLGPAHQMTAGLQEALGSILVDTEAFDEAVVLRQIALDEKIVRHRNEPHPGIVSSLVGVAEALTLAGRFDEAREYIGRAEEMHDRLSSGPSVYFISTERSLGKMARRGGRPGRGRSALPAGDRARRRALESSGPPLRHLGEARLRRLPRLSGPERRGRRAPGVGAPGADRQPRRAASLHRPDPRRASRGSGGVGVHRGSKSTRRVASRLRTSPRRPAPAPASSARFRSASATRATPGSVTGRGGGSISAPRPANVLIRANPLTKSSPFVRSTEYGSFHMAHVPRSIRKGAARPRHRLLDRVTAKRRREAHRARPRPPRGRRNRPSGVHSLDARAGTVRRGRTPNEGLYMKKTTIWLGATLVLGTGAVDPRRADFPDGRPGHPADVGRGDGRRVPGLRSRPGAARFDRPPG